MSKIGGDFIHCADASNARVAHPATFCGKAKGTKARFVRISLLFAIVFIVLAAESKTENFRPAEMRRQAAELLRQHFWLEHRPVRAVVFTMGSMELQTERGTQVFPFKDMTLEITGSFVNVYWVAIDGRPRLLHTGGSYHTQAEQLVTVLRRLKMESAKASDPAAEAAFSDVASRYRAANPKPDFPEEARRLRVQAGAMLREKRFVDAADYYGEALLAVPWWPEGRFNRALVLGELRDFGDAVREMRRYLQLVPDAANSRAAQDKIYEWEALAK